MWAKDDHVLSEEQGWAGGEVYSSKILNWSVCSLFQTTRWESSKRPHNIWVGGGGPCGPMRVQERSRTLSFPRTSKQWFHPHRLISLNYFFYIPMQTVLLHRWWWWWWFNVRPPSLIKFNWINFKYLQTLGGLLCWMWLWYTLFLSLTVSLVWTESKHSWGKETPTERNLFLPTHKSVILTENGHFTDSRSARCIF